MLHLVMSVDFFCVCIFSLKIKIGYICDAPDLSVSILIFRISLPDTSALVSMGLFWCGIHLILCFFCMLSDFCGTKR